MAPGTEVTRLVGSVKRGSGKKFEPRNEKIGLYFLARGSGNFSRGVYFFSEARNFVKSLGFRIRGCWKFKRVNFSGFEALGGRVSGLQASAPLSKAIRKQLDVAREHAFWATGVVDCCVYATQSKPLPTNGRPNFEHAL
jgi:hypothetical protein